MLDIRAHSHTQLGVRALAPIGLSFAAIEAAAWQVVQTHCDTDVLPVDLDAILTGTGGRTEVFTDPMLLTTSPEVEVFGPGDYLIRVPYYHARPRRRFLIAGGIGRYVLHSGFHTLATVPPDGSGDPEARMHWEACAFASALLLPQAMLKAYVAHEDDSLPAVAHSFDVTERLVANRLHALQTIAPDT